MAMSNIFSTELSDQIQKTASGIDQNYLDQIETLMDRDHLPCMFNMVDIAEAKRSGAAYAVHQMQEQLSSQFHPVLLLSIHGLSQITAVCYPDQEGAFQAMKAELGQWASEEQNELLSQPAYSGRTIRFDRYGAYLQDEQGGEHAWKLMIL